MCTNAVLYYLCIDARLIKIDLYSMQIELVEKPCTLSQAGLCVKVGYRKMIILYSNRVGRKTLCNKPDSSELRAKIILTSSCESKNRARYIIRAKSNELIRAWFNIFRARLTSRVNSNEWNWIDYQSLIYYQSLTKDFRPDLDKPCCSKSIYANIELHSEWPRFRNSRNRLDELKCLEDIYTEQHPGLIL